jgi:hypothetical protein
MTASGSLGQCPGIVADPLAGLVDAIAARLVARTPAPVVDELLPVTREALAPLSLEYRPILELAQAGTLRTVWIGRRRYTKRSWLVDLADALPSAADAPAEQPVDELKAAVRKMAEREARKAAKALNATKLAA